MCVMLQGDLGRVSAGRKWAFLDDLKVTECLATNLISFSLEFVLISACQQVPPNLESQGVKSHPRRTPIQLAHLPHVD